MEIKQVFDNYHGVDGFIACPDSESTDDILNEIWSENVYDCHPDYVKGKVVLDIGANFGSFSSWAAAAGAARVIAYEPVKSSFYLLSVNSFLHPVIEPVNKAVMGYDGEVSISVDSIDPGSSFVGDGTEAVEAVSFDNVLKSFYNEISFLKLDVEGSEYSILNDCDLDLLKRVKRIAIEFHGPNMYSFIDKEDFGLMMVKLCEWGSIRVIGRPSNGGFVYGVKYD